MADDKRGRDKQADDAERRQRERELQEARDRADEPEPVASDSSDQLGDLDEALAEHDYPTTTEELRRAYGNHEVETQDGSESIETLLAPIDDESYESADDARDRILGLIRR